MANKNIQPNYLYVFDVDGTLIDSNDAIKKCQLEGLIRASNSDPNDLEFLLNNQGLDKTLNTLGINKDDYFINYYKTFNPHVAALHKEISTINGTYEVLEELKNRKSILAVISNSSKNHTMEKLDALYLTRFFDFIFAESMSGKSKPSPYMAEQLIDKLKGKKKLGQIEKIYNIGDSIVDMMFGDALYDKVRGASKRKYDFKNFLITNRAHQYDQQNFIAVDNLKDVLNYKNESD